MKQWTASLAALVVGVGVGVGIGMMISKSKLDNSQAVITELMAQSQKSKAESEETIRKASAEIGRSKTDLSRSQTQVSQLNTELMRVKAELARAQNQIQSLTVPPAQVEAAEPTSQPAATAAPSGPVTEYTIKDGDSLWKIAEQQLGNGMRYKEILLLNPNITEKQTLVVGSKLKLPSQKN